MVKNKCVLCLGLFFPPLVLFFCGFEYHPEHPLSSALSFILISLKIKGGELGIHEDISERIDKRNNKRTGGIKDGSELPHWETF